MAGRIRVFIAASLDGFIAGPNDDLSWLPAPEPGASEDFGYGAFFRDIGALLLGRRTYDVAAGFEGEWPYEDRPVLVATTRPLVPKLPTVRPVRGAPHELARQAKAAAEGKDVYLDGGRLIRSFLDAGCIDEIVLTWIPIVLGAGHPLFAGTSARHPLTLLASRSLPGGLLQVTYAPRRVSRP